MYTDIYELNIIKKLQYLDIDEQCRLVSKPFNTISFIVIGIFLYLFKILNLKELVFLSFGSFIVFIIKMIFKRKRPYHRTDFVLNKSKKKHGNKKIKSDKYSFPSGHSFSAILFSLILMKKYNYFNLLSLIPILVGFSRIYLGVHYPLDVLAGSGIGAIVSVLIFKFQKFYIKKNF